MDKYLVQIPCQAVSYETHRQRKIENREIRWGDIWHCVQGPGPGWWWSRCGSQENPTRQRGRRSPVHCHQRDLPFKGTQTPKYRPAPRRYSHGKETDPGLWIHGHGLEKVYGLCWGWSRLANDPAFNGTAIERDRILSWASGAAQGFEASVCVWYCVASDGTHSSSHTTETCWLIKRWNSNSRISVSLGHLESLSGVTPTR